jgi:diaminohydroxyphosphoribosylaminopyrimidine deaminase/5-amino-6-(5-phosphoribosylamino)uracil reductase
MFSTTDEHHMQHALALGRRALGTTGSRPAVGCVIVRDGIVVGAGSTGEGGAPHAEAAALAAAGEAARAATAYVTLEPCSHHGATPPCADALVASGVARVIVAIADPDPRVDGRGLKRLREAGIAVETGLLAKAARRGLDGFLSRMTRGRPVVTLKMAVSADGMIARAPGERTAISGEPANARTHLMRARADAIMVGANTVRVDDPSLTCRLPGLEHRTPIAVVVDGRLSMPASAQLVAHAGQRPLMILTSEDAENAGLTAGGAEIIRCDTTAPFRIRLSDCLMQLGRRGINSLLVEGGADLARCLADEDLIDRVVLIASRTPLGPQGVKAGLDVNAFRRVEQETLGEDTLTIYEKALL